MTAETIAFIFGCTLVAIVVVMMISNIVYHPIQYIRKLRTPPCSKCKNCHINCYNTQSDRCRSETYLDHEERLNGFRWESVEISYVRGTRFCKFEERKEKK